MSLEMNGIGAPDDLLSDRTTNRDVIRGTVRKYKAVVGHLSCDLNGEAVILNMKNGKYYGINSVGASIWTAIQAPVTFANLESAILTEYDVDEATCRRAIESFLEQMENEGLIEFFDE